MLILTIRTDKPDAEIGLFDDGRELAYKIWSAHRQLAETIHKEIHGLLKSQQKDWHDIQAISIYKGPGSFTGLRIGISTASALADGLNLPIVGESGERWIEHTITALQKGGNDRLVMPEYGALPRTTEPKH